MAAEAAALEASVRVGATRSARIAVLESELLARGVDPAGIASAPAGVAGGVPVDEYTAVRAEITRLENELSVAHAMADAAAVVHARGADAAELRHGARLVGEFLTQKAQLIGYLRERRAIAAFHSTAALAPADPAAVRREFASFIAADAPRRTQALRTLEAAAATLIDSGLGTTATTSADGAAVYAGLDDVHRLVAEVEESEARWLARSDAAAAAFEARGERLASLHLRLAAVAEWRSSNAAQVQLLTPPAAAAFAAALEREISALDTELASIAAAAAVIPGGPAVVRSAFTAACAGVLGLCADLAGLIAAAPASATAPPPSAAFPAAQTLAALDQVQRVLSLAGDAQSRGAVAPIAARCSALRSAVAAAAGGGGGSDAGVVAAGQKVAVGGLLEVLRSDLAAAAATAAHFDRAAKGAEYSACAREMLAWVRAAVVAKGDPADVFGSWQGLYAHVDALKDALATEAAALPSSAGKA